MSESTSDVHQLARDFIEALSIPDRDRLRELIEPGARFWINIGPVEITAEDRFDVLAVERSFLATLAFDEVRIRPTTDGFVVQATTAATTTVGDPLSIPVCLVVTTDGSRITHVDEYADSAQAAPLLALVDPRRRARGAMAP